MFTGTVSHEGSRELPTAIHDQAVQCAVQLRAQKESYGASSLTRSFDLPDGSLVYVVDAEHVWRVHVVPPREEHYEDEEQRERYNFPVYSATTIAGVVSGAVHVTTLEEATSADVENGVRPEGWHIRNDGFSMMPDTAALFAVPEVSHKIGIPEYAPFAPLSRNIELDYNQFASVWPGNYTGAMCHVVQLLLGVGHILNRDYEQRWLEADESRVRPIMKHVDLDPITQELEEDTGSPTSFYSGEGNTHVQIRYDWRWARTHGIMWGTGIEDTSVPFLVQLGQAGVFAMPFPTDKLSQRPAVQAYYEEVYPELERFRPFKDGEETLFEALGGFPTGETIPTASSERERWQRAGYLLSPENDDLSRFYGEGYPISSGFGWAFHPTAPRAINTMYTFNDRNQRKGYCYELELRIREKPDGQKVRNPRADMVIQALGLRDFIDQYKAVRLSDEQTDSVLASLDYDEFDDMWVDPDWEIRLSLYVLSEGYLEYPGYQCVRPPGSPCGPLMAAPHFKFYEPVIDMVLSFDFETPPDIEDPDRSDGPIFATYVNGQHEILHMFHSYDDPESVQIDTRMVCQYVGRWEFGTVADGNKLVGQFYTSSHEFRKYKDVGSGSLRTTDGEIVGDYDWIGFCMGQGRYGVVYKYFVGSRTWTRESWSAKRHAVSVFCASNNRSVFFTCREIQKRERRHQEGYNSSTVGAGGTRLYASIYNFAVHWQQGWCALPSGNFPANSDCHIMFSAELYNPDSCFGEVGPSPFGYSACFMTADGPRPSGMGPLVVSGPAGGSVIQSANVTPRPVTPPNHSSEMTPPMWDYEYEVRAFGHPLMHNRRIRHWKETVTDYENYTPVASLFTWWSCSMPTECPAPKWDVDVNYYGPPFIGTDSEIGFGERVEFGLRPQVMGRFFGVVY